MEELISKWDEIKQAIRNEYNMTDIAYKTWIAPLELDMIENRTVYIKTLEELTTSIRIIEKKFYTPFKAYINEVMERSKDDQYEVAFVTEGYRKRREDDIKRKNYLKARYKKANINDDYTFDTFIVGINNRLAQASAIAVSEAPGNIYNPLFIYGEERTCKTHLIQSIGHYIIDHNPDANVLYVTSEEFANEVIDILQL